MFHNFNLGYLNRYKNKASNTIFPHLQNKDVIHKKIPKQKIGVKVNRCSFIVRSGLSVCSLFKKQRKNISQSICNLLINEVFHTNTVALLFSHPNR